QVAPMDLNGHNLQVSGLGTGTTTNTANGSGGVSNGNIYNIYPSSGSETPVTLTVAGSTNTTYGGDIGCSNLLVAPFNTQSPFVTGSGLSATQTVAASKNISLTINGPGTLTLAPVSNQSSGNEYTGTTIINGGALRVGRATGYTAGGTPGAQYTVTGAGDV